MRIDVPDSLRLSWRDEIELRALIAQGEAMDRDDLAADRFRLHRRERERRDLEQMQKMFTPTHEDLVALNQHATHLESQVGRWQRLSVLLAGVVTALLVLLTLVLMRSN